MLEGDLGRCSGDVKRSKILSFSAVLRFNGCGSRHSEIGNVDVGRMVEVRKM